MSKLRTNYSLVNIFVRIFFVLGFMFASWQTFLASANTVSQIIPSPLSGRAANLLLALMTSALVGVALMFLTPFLTNRFLNVSHIYSVPRAEFALLAHLHCTVGFFVCGILNLVNLFTPLALVWGGVLFPFVVAVVGCISFYAVTSKLYFNDVTKAHYFKCSAVFYALILLLIGALS